MRLSALLSLLACDDRHVVVLTIEDPLGLAASAEVLAFGDRIGDLTEERPIDGRAFPITVAMTARSPVSGPLYVEARSRGTVRARGSGVVRFAETNPLEIRLAMPCSIDGEAECQNGVFCDGRERCGAEGTCGPGDPPCADPNLWCIEITCVEAALACSVRVDRSIIDFDPCAVPACAADGSLFPAGVEEDGTPCVSPTDPGPSICRGGICGPSTCGDGFVDVRSEACDPAIEVPFCVGCQPAALPLELVAFDSSYGLGSVALSPSGRFIALGLRSEAVDPVFLVDLETGSLTAVRTGTIAVEADALAVSDGGDLATSNYHPGAGAWEVLVWNASTGTLDRIAVPGAAAGSIDIDAGGTILAVGSTQGHLFTLDRSTSIWSNPTADISGPLRGINLDLSANGRTVLATLEVDAEVTTRVFDVGSTTPEIVPTDGFASLSATGRFLTYTADGVVHRLDRENLEDIVIAAPPEALDRAPLVSEGGLVVFTRQPDRDLAREVVVVDIPGAGAFAVDPPAGYSRIRARGLSSDGRTMLMSATGTTSDEDLFLLRIDLGG
jgi:hypothetical protein